MFWIIDLILLVILGLATYIGYKKGIIKMLLSFALVLVALVSAFYLSAPAAEATYDLLLEKQVSSSVDKAMKNQTMETVDQAVDKFLSTGSIGFMVGTVDYNAEGAADTVVGDSVAEISQNLKDNVVRPPAVLMLRVVCAFILFLLIWFVLNFILRLITRSKKLPLFRKANQLLGAVIGFATGLAICVAICALMDLSLTIPSVNLFGNTHQIKDQTFVYDLLSSLFLVH